MTVQQMASLLALTCTHKTKDEEPEKSYSWKFQRSTVHYNGNSPTYNAGSYAMAQLVLTMLQIYDPVLDEIYAKKVVG